MIVLNGSTERLIITSDVAATVSEPFFNCSFATIGAADQTSITGVDSNRGQTNGTAQVELVGPPTGSDERDIKYISIHNEDTAAHTFEIIVDNGSDFPIWHGVLVSLGSATYRDGVWQTYDANGAVFTTSTFTPHATQHQNGGADEINVAGLSGELADDQPPLQATTALKGGTELATQAEVDTGTDTTRIVTPATLSGTSLTFTPAAHAADHQNGGGDEINVGGLSGLLADGQTPLAHASDHENGGGDEVNVGGLSGLLADGQTPLAHASDHENGGGDEISVLGLSGLLADDQNPVTATELLKGGLEIGTQVEVDAGILDDKIVTPLKLKTSPPVDHATRHEDGGADEISVLGLSGLLADAQTPLAHASDHENGGGDEISVLDLSGLLADSQTPLAHAANHVRGGSDEIDGDTLDIDFTPTNYTPDTTPGEVTNVDELTAHLAGIDNELGATSGSRAFGFRLGPTNTVSSIFTDIASADLWLTPYGGNYGQITLKESGGSVVVLTDQAATQIVITGLVTDTNHDVFVWDATGITTEVVAWSTDTVRATALTTDSVLGFVKTGETFKRYAGTFRTISTSKTQDDDLARFIWNYYNRIPRQLLIIETTNSWASSGTIYRQANGSTANTVEVVVGVEEEDIELTATLGILGIGTNVMNAFTGIGINSTTVNGSEITGRHGHDGNNGSDQATSSPTAYLAEKRLGYTSYNWLERVAVGSATLFGTATGFHKSGMYGKVKA